MMYTSLFVIFVCLQFYHFQAFSVILLLICYHFYVLILFIRCVIMFIFSVCYHIFAPILFICGLDIIENDFSKCK